MNLMNRDRKASSRRSTGTLSKFTPVSLKWSRNGSADLRRIEEWRVAALRPEKPGILAREHATTSHEVRLTGATGCRRRPWIEIESRQKRVWSSCRLRE